MIFPLETLHRNVSCLDLNIKTQYFSNKRMKIGVLIQMRHWRRGYSVVIRETDFYVNG